MAVFSICFVSVLSILTRLTQLAKQHFKDRDIDVAGLPFNNEFPPTPILVFRCPLGKFSDQNQNSLSILANNKTPSF